MQKPDFYIYDEITMDMAREAAMTLLKGVKRTRTIWIASPGGSIEAALALAAVIDHLRSEGVRIHMHIASIAYSCAAYISQFADHRTISAHSRMMIHSAYSEFANDKITQLAEAELVFELHTLTSYSTSMFEAIARRSNKSENFIIEQLRHNRGQWFLSAEEIMEHNLADEVIPFAPYQSETSRKTVPDIVHNSEYHDNVVSLPRATKTRSPSTCKTLASEAS